MIYRAVSAIGIVHAGQFKNRMSMAQRVHIDQQHLTVLQHNVLDVIVSMHHMHVLRHRFNERVQLLKLILRQVILQKTRPVQRNRSHVRHAVRPHRLGMDQFQEIRAHLCHFIDCLFFADQQFGKARRVQQLKHRSVSAAFDAYHIIWNRGGHADHECSPGQLPLSLYLRKRIRIQIHLDNRITIDPVYFPICPLADHLASFNRENAVCLFHLHHVCKSRHFKDIVDLRMRVDNLRIIHILLQPEDNAQPCAGRVLQLIKIHNNGLSRMLLQNLPDRLLYIRCVCGINQSLQQVDQCSVFNFIDDLTHGFTSTVNTGSLIVRSSCESSGYSPHPYNHRSHHPLYSSP